MTQSRLLSYIDVYFGLAAIAAAGVLLLILARVEVKRGEHRHFHAW